MEARSNQVAHLLRSYGLAVGDTVAIVMDNRIEYFEATWGAMRAGLYVTPINWHLSADETRYIVDNCGARVVLAATDTAPLLDGITVTRLVAGGAVDGFESYEAKRDEQPTTPIADECEGSWMFYSSGTTGRPKGIKPASVGGHSANRPPSPPWSRACTAAANRRST